MGSSVFLSPHNDDEVLFGAFTLLRENPHVVTVLRSVKQSADVSSVMREEETRNALSVLGVTSYEQWGAQDVNPDWKWVRFAIADLAPRFKHCYAPYPEFQEHGYPPGTSCPPGYGVYHHDVIGYLAESAFGYENVTFYKTYTKFGGRVTSGTEVEYEPEWLLLKLKALACYESQIKLASTAPHFIDQQREYYA